jgi:UDP-galactopyranose mutase
MGGNFMSEQGRDDKGNQPTSGESERTASAPSGSRQDEAEPAAFTEPDLVCFSHLRWDFIYQRPQHLLSRCARTRRVFFVEEPVFGSGPPRLEVSPRDSGVLVAVPHLPEEMRSGIALWTGTRELIDSLFAGQGIRDYVLWYYTPMALESTSHLSPLITVYDCMDELSAFMGAPAELGEREAELFRRADLVFTGGRSLYEAKRGRHPSVHLFPSSIDREHFARARGPLEEPADQVTLPRPRLGYFGSIDERLDIELLDAVARARPDWQLVMIGPVVKIDPATLPRPGNIHYLGWKSYEELPAYIAGWDLALLPFARNESTRFTSPTKTPEYLAAGRPVVSTSIPDVVRPYGEAGLVRIADTPEEFVRAAEAAMAEGAGPDWLAPVDDFLAGNSWDETWAQMSRRIDEATAARRESLAAAQGAVA